MAVIERNMLPFSIITLSILCSLCFPMHFCFSEELSNSEQMNIGVSVASNSDAYKVSLGRFNPHEIVTRTLTLTEVNKNYSIELLKPECDCMRAEVLPAGLQNEPRISVSLRANGSEGIFASRLVVLLSSDQVNAGENANLPPRGIVLEFDYQISKKFTIVSKRDLKRDGLIEKNLSIYKGDLWRSKVVDSFEVKMPSSWKGDAIHVLDVNGSKGRDTDLLGEFKILWNKDKMFGAVRVPFEMSVNFTEQSPLTQNNPIEPIDIAFENYSGVSIEPREIFLGSKKDQDLSFTIHKVKSSGSEACELLDATGNEIQKGNTTELADGVFFSVQYSADRAGINASPIGKTSRKIRGYVRGRLGKNEYYVPLLSPIP